MANPDWAGVYVIITGFAIALMCLLAIAIHECGHLLVGLALGFRCRGIRFGRFSIGSDFRVSRHQDASDAALGSAFMIPQHWEKIRMREILMLLAGPVASFLSGYAAFQLWSNPSLISGSFIGVSFFFAGYNLLPHGLQGQATDGERIWMLLFQPERALRFVAISRLVDEIDRNVPLEQLSANDLERATKLKDESAETVWAHTVAFLSAYIQHDDLKAGQLLETALRYSGSAVTAAREQLALQAAMYQASRRGRVDLARHWLSEVPASTSYSEFRSNIESAIRDS